MGKIDPDALTLRLNSLIMDYAIRGKNESLVELLSEVSWNTAGNYLLAYTEHLDCERCEYRIFKYQAQAGYNIGAVLKSCREDSSIPCLYDCAEDRYGRHVSFLAEGLWYEDLLNVLA